MDYTYQFPVVKGKQANRDYFIAMVPLGMLSKLFPSEDEYVSPEFRAQRKLNESRVPVIKKYILENRDNYVFSALAASIDGDFSFHSDYDNLNAGILEVSMDSHFLINDGQHRKAAIIEALKEDDSLKNETIPIVFYADKGLARSQQIFTDLNKNAVKTSNSISELYDSRDPLAVITRNVIKNNSFLNMYTDKERDILGKYSSSLFTLHTFYSANKTILGSDKTKKDDMKFLNHYWASVVNNMQPWQDLAHGEIHKTELREEFIATQGVVIQALGKLGNYFYKNQRLDSETELIKLKKINWNRNNPEWYMRAINNNGRIITSKKGVVLISIVIKKHLKITLSSDEQRLETQLQLEIGKNKGE